MAHTPPPPPPPHRKSGVPDLRKRKPISGKPEMGGEESSLSADLRLVKLISGKPEMSGEESPSRCTGAERSAVSAHVLTLFLTDDASSAIGGSVLFPEGRAREASQEAGAGHGLVQGLATLATRGPGCAPGLPAAPGQASSEKSRLS
jgi:hypothetical protein